MRNLGFLLLLVLGLAIGISAAPSEHDSAAGSAIEAPVITYIDKMVNFSSLEAQTGGVASSRYRCGSFKFDDNTTQDMVSQAWNNRPVQERYCRPIKYSLARVDGKAGKDANMVAAKIDKGCTCFFYEKSCVGESAESWEGWDGWDNYFSTDKHFIAWWCLEHD